MPSPHRPHSKPLHLLPTSTPHPSPRRNSLSHHSTVDLPCLLIVFGLLFCSLSVFSLSFMLSEGDCTTPIPPSLALPAASCEKTPPLYQTHRRYSAQEIADRTGSRFFVRDWPLWLGFNNIRYILEASLLQASLLNRTLVIPSHLVGRACEHHFSVCADWAPMVNRGNALGKGEWDQLPTDEQWAWILPIELFIDLDHLQAWHSVITTADFLELHGVPATVETTTGRFDKSAYLPADARSSSFATVTESTYDKDVLRVDHLPAVQWTPTGAEAQDDEVARDLRAWVGEAKEKARRWEDLKSAFRSHEESAEEFGQRMAREGVVGLETFAGSINMEYTKTVVEPLREAALADDVRGWWDDHHASQVDVLHLEGETHLGRKPGQMRFTTSAARDRFASSVLFAFHPPAAIVTLADRLSARMRDRVGGRQWLGAHARRGDFVQTGWVMETTAEAHIARVQERLSRGRSILEEKHADHSFQPYDVALLSASNNDDNGSLLPPLATDSFFLATGERNASSLALFRTHGAVLVHDLLTPADRQQMDPPTWGLHFTDVLALVEQELLARAGFFYGHAMSSFTGGVVNRRASLGKDRRLALVD